MNEKTRTDLLEILLVEDSHTDVRMTREALACNNVRNPLHVVESGAAAMRYLRREGPYSTAHRPGLILLDLNLPGKSGNEVLAEIKDDVDLRKIPVVVFATSPSLEEVTTSYELHANCLISKPTKFENLVEVVRSIHNFWSCIVALPRDES